MNVVGWLELLFPLWVLLVSTHLLLESFPPAADSGISALGTARGTGSPPHRQLPEGRELPADRVAK